MKEENIDEAIELCLNDDFNLSSLCEVLNFAQLLVA